MSFRKVKMALVGMCAGVGMCVGFGSVEAPKYVEASGYDQRVSGNEGDVLLRDRATNRVAASVDKVEVVLDKVSEMKRERALAARQKALEEQERLEAARALEAKREAEKKERVARELAKKALAKKALEKKELEKKQAASRLADSKEVKTVTPKMGVLGVSTYKKSSRSSGKTVRVSATAYIATCRGCSGRTATGIDVRRKTTYKGMCIIAVDPKVIPLGTKLKYGSKTCVAADRGGAIRGNHVDVLVGSYKSAINFGRKNITLKMIGKVKLP